MAKFGPSAADLPAVKKENAMVKSAKQSNQKANPKRVAVIRNGMTAAEMKASGEEWANHKGPYMTLKEVLSVEANKVSS